MNTKRLWNPLIDDRRLVSRKPVDFYAVELANGARYLRKICNFSEGGLMLEDRLTFQKPGALVELELPRRGNLPLRVLAQVVRVTGKGEVGLRTIGAPTLKDLGGHIEL